MDAEIVTQLVWIKWALILIFVGIVIPAVTTTVFMVSAIRGLQKGRDKKVDRFGDELEELVNKGLNEEVRKRAEERLREYPADAYALWFHGKSCYLLGDSDAATESLQKAKELHPSWAKKHVNPFLEVIQDRVKDQRADEDSVN